MASTHHVELETAKLLQKLIQESKEGPAKLATKLRVICQHMKFSGKEHSFPYQVISRANEKIVNQHGLDMNALSSSRLPLSCEPRKVDFGHEATNGKETTDNQLPANQNDLHHGAIPAGMRHGASSSKTKEVNSGLFQKLGVLQASKIGPDGLDMTRHELIFSSKPPVGLGRVDSMPVDAHRGSFSHRSVKSSEQGSSACVPMYGTRSANSRGIHFSRKSDSKTNKKNTKKVCIKRKRAEYKAASDTHSENPHQSDNISTGSNPRKGKQVSKDGLQGQVYGKYDYHAHINPVQNATGVASLIRAEPGGHSSSERIWDEVKNSNPYCISPKNHDDGKMSCGQSTGLQWGKILPRSSILGYAPVGSQNRLPLSQVSQGNYPDIMEPSSDMNNVSAYHVSEPKGLTLGPNKSSKLTRVPSNFTYGSGKAFGAASAFSSFAMEKMSFSHPAYQNSSPFGNQYTASKLQNKNYLGSCSDSQFLKEGADANSINVSVVSPGSAKIASDRILHIPRKNSEASSSSSLHASAATARFDASVKAVFQEKRDGLQIRSTSYTNPKIRGVQERHCLDNVSLERKLKSWSSLDTVPSTNASFNDQQLRQLRAQWLLFLAFRNNLVPRNLYLKIALGGNCTHEGGGADGALRVLNDYRGTDTSARDSTDNHERSGMYVRANDATKGSTACSSGGSMGRDSSLKVTKSLKKNMKKLDMSMASKAAFSNTICRLEDVEDLLASGPMAALNLFANQLIDGLAGIEVVQQLIGVAMNEQADKVARQKETSVKLELRIIELEAELAAARQEVVELKHSLKMGH